MMEIHSDVRLTAWYEPHPPRVSGQLLVSTYWAGNSRRGNASVPGVRGDEPDVSERTESRLWPNWWSPLRHAGDKFSTQDTWRTKWQSVHSWLVAKPEVLQWVRVHSKREHILNQWATIHFYDLSRGLEQGLGFYVNHENIVHAEMRHRIVLGSSDSLRY